MILFSKSKTNKILLIRTGISRNKKKGCAVVARTDKNKKSQSKNSILLLYSKSTESTEFFPTKSLSRLHSFTLL